MKDYLDSSTLFFIDRVLMLISTYVSSILLFIRFKGIKMTLHRIIYVVIFSIVIPTTIQLLGGISSIPIRLIYIFIMSFSIIMIDKDIHYSVIPLAVISVAISLYSEYISASVCSFLLFYMNLTKNKLINTIVTCALQLIICIILSQNNKLKRWFNHLKNESHFGLGLLISSYVFAFSLLLTQSSSIGFANGMILVAVCPLAFTGLILWIRSIVQRYNKNKLKNREDEHTQQEITEKNARIERLEGEVATLAKQLHRDNHLLSSVERSVQTIAETDSANKRKQLADEFHTLYSERNDMIVKEQQESKILPSTGIAMIDSSLSEMYVKATANGIAFDLIVGAELYYLVNNIINQTELQTLLCDHIKDAVIAVTTAKDTNGKILVTIEKNDGLFEIAIRDNGIEFAPDTLAKLGRERVTTHADEGGSGIGFMTTFETLAKTKGSLIITEYEAGTPFTKAVTFVFDGLHRFVISSYRKDKLKEIVTRDDVILL